jgi:hypothetical protein
MISALSEISIRNMKDLVWRKIQVFCAAMNKLSPDNLPHFKGGEEDQSQPWPVSTIKSCPFIRFCY